MQDDKIPGALQGPLCAIITVKNIEQDQRLKAIDRDGQNHFLQ
jgi:hypothetical protein